jgi:plastocyanin
MVALLMLDDVGERSGSIFRKGGGMESNTKVTVSVRMENGRLWFEPWDAHVQRGQGVEWRLEGVASFVVDFGDKSPLAEGPRQGGDKGATATVRLSAGPGTYKYAAAGWDGRNLDVVDPDLIVDPSPPIRPYQG